MPGNGPPLEPVTEAGEFTSGTIREGGESYVIRPFGAIIGYSRQLLVNDPVGAFAQGPARLGVSARALEAGEIAALIASNPVMSDGAPVFHSTRGNIRNATGQTVENLVTDLTAARTAMRKTQGLAGEVLGLAPAYVLVPPDLETSMERALSAVQATRTADVNPFAALKLVVEPRLAAATTWYLAADPAMIDGIELAHLAGAPGPQIETRAGFEVDGVQIKVRLDFGCGWLDWRGWQRIG